MVRSFAREEVAPVAAQLDERAEFPWQNIKKMGDLGLLGVPWSEDLGGAGTGLHRLHDRDPRDGEGRASHAITISAHTTLGTSPIVALRDRRTEATASFRCSPPVAC